MAIDFIKILEGLKGEGREAKFIYEGVTVKRRHVVGRTREFLVTTGGQEYNATLTKGGVLDVSTPDGTNSFACSEPNELAIIAFMMDEIDMAKRETEAAELELEVKLSKLEKENGALKAAADAATKQAAENYRRCQDIAKYQARQMQEHEQTIEKMSAEHLAANQSLQSELDHALSTMADLEKMLKESHNQTVFTRRRYDLLAASLDSALNIRRLTGDFNE